MRHLKKQSKQSKAINRIFLPLAIIIAVFMLSPPSYANPEPEEIFGLGKNKKKKDPFSKKVDKKKHKPNIYSSRPLRTKSRSKLYVHSISRKKVKKTNQSVFSASKPRYNITGAKPGKSSRKENRGRRSEK